MNGKLRGNKTQLLVFFRIAFATILLTTAASSSLANDFEYEVKTKDGTVHVVKIITQDLENIFVEAQFLGKYAIKRIDVVEIRKKGNIVTFQDLPGAIKVEKPPPKKPVKPEIVTATTPATGTSFRSSNFDYYGMLRTRGASFSKRRFIAERGRDSQFIATRANLGLNFYINNENSVVTNLQHASIWGGREGSNQGFIAARDTSFGVAGGGVFSQQNLDIRELYYTTVLSKRHTLRFGRQVMSLSNARFIGAYDWLDTGRSFDGIFHRWRIRDRHTLESITVMLNETNSFNTQNDSTNNTFVPANDTYMAGSLYSWQFANHWSFEPMLIGQHQANRAVLNSTTGDFEANGLKDTRLTAVATVLLLPGKASSFDLETTISYQLGESSSRNEKGKQESIAAYAGALAGGYSMKKLFLKKSFFRIGLAVDVASGDLDPADSTNETFNNLYGSNHGLLGLSDYLSWRNVIGGRLDFTLSSKRVGSQLVNRHFYKLSTYTSRNKFKAEYWSATLSYGNYHRFAKADVVYTPLGTRDSALISNTDELGLFHEISLKYVHNFSFINFETGLAVTLAQAAVTAETEDTFTPVFLYLQSSIYF